MQSYQQKINHQSFKIIEKQILFKKKIGIFTVNKKVGKKNF